MKTIYINLEDDIEKITRRLRKERATEVVLVFPKKSFLFADEINLRLLKKQVDLLGKNVAILTMDEHGQEYAREAGFALKTMPKHHAARGSIDIRPRHIRAAAPPAAEPLSQRMLKHIRPLATASVAVRDNIFDQPAVARARRSIHISGPRKIFISVLLAAVVVASFLVFIVIPSAVVTVHAKTQGLSRDLEINLSTQTPEADANQLVMPAVRIDETRIVSDTVTVAGTKEVGTTAQGQVRIYNLTGQPMNLKASTTTLSANGKTYLFTSDQNQVRSVSAGSSNAPTAAVVATGPGESFNLAAGTRLEITNKVFGNRPDRLYAVSAGISGGTSRFIAQISQKDLDDAKAALQAGALRTVLQDLSARQQIIPEGGSAAVVDDFSTDKPLGTETPTFTAQAKVRVTGLAYQQDRLTQLVRQRLAMTLSSAKKLQEPAKDTSSIKVKNLDLNAGTMALSVHYESLAIAQMDSDSVKDQIAGRSVAEASQLLLANADIDRVEITVWPKWVTNVPRLTSKIDVNVVQAE